MDRGHPANFGAPPETFVLLLRPQVANSRHGLGVEACRKPPSVVDALCLGLSSLRWPLFSVPFPSVYLQRHSKLDSFWLHLPDQRYQRLSAVRSCSCVTSTTALTSSANAPPAAPPSCNQSCHR